jgi:hypothetical protein
MQIPPSYFYKAVYDEAWTRAAGSPEVCKTGPDGHHRPLRGSAITRFFAAIADHWADLRPTRPAGPPAGRARW